MESRDSLDLGPSPLLRESGSSNQDNTGENENISRYSAPGQECNIFSEQEKESQSFCVKIVFLLEHALSSRQCQMKQINDLRETEYIELYSLEGRLKVVCYSKPEEK